MSNSSFFSNVARVLRQPRSPQFIAVLISAWLVLVSNWALLNKVNNLEGNSLPPTALKFAFAGLAFLAILTLMALTAWPRTVKPAAVVLTLVAAVAQYFMLNYGTVMDKGMIHNALQTDWHESRDLLNPSLLLQLVLIVGIPSLWLWQQPIVRRGMWRNAWRSLALFALALGLLVGSVLAFYPVLSPLVRNNMDLRFMINPVSPVLATFDAAIKPMFKHPKPFASIAAGASVLPANGSDKRPPLLVLVVGETARADHFSLNGYARNTNPELAQRGVLSWQSAQSCGTATRESLPCMFSHLSREQLLKSKVEYDGLLDVIQAAGMAVLWVDNQAGCKGVCNRIPTESTQADLLTSAGQRHCDASGECLDGLLVDTMDERLSRLDPKRVQNGVVLVLHQMGSHGPAYYKRSDTARKAFLPECTTNALSDCTSEQVVNVYDNSIRYTDHVLAGLIDWLKTKPQFATGLMYVSDHGESLGEKGIYLHGMPWQLAPDAQKHVPWIMWPGSLANRNLVNWTCVEKTVSTPLTHDNYYHTVLGLLGIQSPTYAPALDVLTPCRSHPSWRAADA